MALPQSYVTVSRRPPDVEDYIDMLRRYRSWIVGPMFLGLVVSTIVAFLWPDTFVSKAVLRITPQQVSERLVPAEFNTQMTQRLNEMEQSILSRTTLEGIITDPTLDLYKRDRVTRTMEDVVSDMRTHDIDIRPIQVPGTPGADSNRQISTAFSISFSYQDRYKAQAVVRALVSKFVDQNQQFQRDNAHLTTAFLEDELKVAQAKLVALDDQITKFKLANNGKLPEELTSNTNMLNSSLLQQSQLTQSLQNAIDRKSMYETTLQGQLSQLDYLKANAEETVTPLQSAQAQVQNQALASATARLQELNERLAGIKQTLGPKAPEVRMLTAQVASAQQTKDNLEKEQQQKKESEAAQPGGPAEKKIRNKNAEAAIVNLQAQIDQTKTMINEAAGNIKLLQSEQENIAKRISAYEARIQAAPLNEGPWATLLRDHALAQQEYDEKMKKRQAADTAQNLEEHKAGEMLEVLDTPSDPQQPTEPKRVQWAAIGTGLGLLLGIILAGAKEMKNTSLKNLKDVRAYTNLPVLSSIPLLENALLVRRKRRLFWLAWSGVFIFGSMAVLASVYYYFVGQK
jgi:succinoglycan biosynthesis transport protein ExoP